MVSYDALEMVQIKQVLWFNAGNGPTEMWQQKSHNFLHFQFLGRKKIERLSEDTQICKNKKTSQDDLKYVQITHLLPAP